ncbi:MAG: cadherin-like beta sandwich domain-containing protein [Bacilli bacterium]|nr:cadherin-like beta sandwich domain-containing protein [Bacilli bacterium]
MKKIYYTLVVLITFTLLTISVKAAPSYSFNVSSSSIENGRSVSASVTIRNAAAWDIKITSSGNTYGCDEAWSDVTSNGNDTTKTYTTTCKSNSIGTIAFVLSGNITSSDEQKIYLSGSKRVSVVEPRKAATNNALKALSVDNYELSPTFDSEVLEYSVEVPNEVNTIVINATKQESHASIEGIGEKEVIEGTNKFEIKVTAENGDARVYNLLVNVKDNNPIIVLDNLTVVKNSKNIIIPDNFKEDKITINDIEVPAFINENLNIILVALKDANGNTNFYRYENNTYIKYIELNSKNLSIYPLEIEEIPYKKFNKVDKNIDGNNIKAFQYKNLSNYFVIYAMDLTNGNKNYYLYDVNDKTFQIFDEELYNSLVEDNQIYLYMLIGSLFVILLSIIIMVFLSAKLKKLRSKINEIKYEKNQIEQKQKVTKKSKKKKEE